MNLIPYIPYIVVVVILGVIAIWFLFSRIRPPSISSRNVTKSLSVNNY
jgi:uncharacterized membrane protein YqiK